MTPASTSRPGAASLVEQLSRQPEEPDVLEVRDDIVAPCRPDQFETLIRRARDPESAVLLSLGGGSLPGLCGNVALVGMLEELELRETVDVVWGTSAGAIVGGAWCSGTPADEILAQIKTLDRPGSIDVDWLRVALSFLGRPLGVQAPDALFRGRVFHRTIANSLRVSRIEECDPPFRALACADDGSIRRKVFREGPLLAAISASMSLPGLLLPRDEHGKPMTGWYDGGLIERTPLFSPLSEHQRKGDPRRPLVIGTYFDTSARRPETARGFVKRFLFTILSLEDQLWEHHKREAHERGDADLLILDPGIDDPELFDFKRVERNYLQARRNLKHQLSDARIAITMGCS